MIIENDTDYHNKIQELHIKRKPLVATVKESLIEFIKKNKLEGTVLPSEEKLCKMIGVSRTTLRNALAILEMDGIIIKKQGIGTYVSKQSLHPRIRLNEAPEFSAFIRSYGYQSTIQFISCEIRSDLDEINEKLKRKIGQNIIEITKNFLADGIPAIHCIDYVPMDLIKGKFSESDFQINIFDFLEFKCNERVIYNITQIIPMVAEGKIAQYMGIENGVPIIMFSEIGYNKSDKAVIYSKEYYVPDLIEMNIFRKKI